MFTLAIPSLLGGVMVYSLLFVSLFSLSAFAGFNPREGRPWPEEGLDNPYELNATELKSAIREGRLHALHYPVEITGLKIPYRPTKEIFDDIPKNPLRWIAQRLARKFSGVKSFDDLMGWLGLYPYPQEEGEGAYFIPFKDGMRPTYRMGETHFSTNNGLALSLSCATCHSANLFGTPVLGLTNKRPRANEFMRLGVRMMQKGNEHYFGGVSSATWAEKRMFRETRKKSWFVESITPEVYGLDTSLAHVALSLSHREPGGYAEMTRRYRRRPREENLRSFVADSKPLPWWNVKYKNKWLSDGSVVAGNPIFTNILWNEIGRGTDLHELEDWLEENEQIIKELTTAVFSAEAPRWTDFFDPQELNFEDVVAGQRLFNQRCEKCHGSYIKPWNEEGFEPSSFSGAELYQTVRVEYFEDTPVKNVGTDPQRWQGMASLLQLNDLEISKKNGIKIKLQKGYVPPPLVGVWARWPYFHNNSAANLCEVLTRGADRVEGYWAGPAENKNRDFDQTCVGYPLGDKAPEDWLQKPENYFDSTKPGLGRGGHDERIFVRDGRELLSPQDKRQIIEFLKTL